MPAITDGSAEQSMSASTWPTAARSSALAHVASHERDPRLAQPREVQLGAAAPQVVERDELPVGMTRREPDAEVGADEAGPAGDQNPSHCAESTGQGPQ